MARIHPTALVDAGARLADDCEVGPYCRIGPEVEIGEGTEIGAGCQFTNKVTVGKGNRFYPYCCIGFPPQDVSYAGDSFAVRIGDGNTFREFVTVNMGSAKEQGVTRIGSQGYFMAYSHVAHDCCVGDHVVLVNCVAISGHCHIEDHAIISGLTGVHQFATIGKHAFIGGLSRIIHDAPPFMMIEGNPAKVHRVNVVGLQRHGFSAESVDGLKQAHRILYRSKLTREDAFKIVEAGEGGTTPDVQYLIAFLRRQMAGRQGRQREAMRGQH